MTNHTTTESHDPAMSAPGHNSLLVYVHETRSTGLHCDGCPDWYGGRFKGRWAEKQMAEAWARHVANVRAEEETSRRIEWTWRHRDFIAENHATTDQAEAQRFVDACRRAHPGDDVALVRRTVTPWTDAERSHP